MSINIDRIFVIGLGAIGAKYASKLHEHNPGKVKIVADTGRIDRFRDSPVRVNEVPIDFDYVAPDEAEESADLILVAVKFDQLEQAVNDIRNFIGPETTVMSLLNGITSEQVIGGHFGHERVLYANVYMDAVREGNDVRYSDIGRIVFGEKDNSRPSARVLAIQSLFQRSGIPCTVPDDMLHAHWSKFMLNVGVNQTSAILRAPYGAFQTDSYARELMVMAAREVVAIAQKHGINLGETDIARMVAIIDSLNPVAKTSMLQDIDQRRSTEVQIFGGAVIELGLAAGVPTPVNEVFYKTIRAMEHQCGPNSF